MTLPARWAPPHIPRQVSKFARSAATTFAPRASGATGKNPAYKGSVLYTIFEVQVRLGSPSLTSTFTGAAAGRGTLARLHWVATGDREAWLCPVPEVLVRPLLQAWAALAVGGLLSFNLLFPSDQPDIARLIG